MLSTAGIEKDAQACLHQVVFVSRISTPTPGHLRLGLTSCEVSLEVLGTSKSLLTELAAVRLGVRCVTRIFDPFTALRRCHRFWRQ